MTRTTGMLRWDVRGGKMRRVPKKYCGSVHPQTINPNSCKPYKVFVNDWSTRMSTARFVSRFQCSTANEPTQTSSSKSITSLQQRDFKIQFAKKNIVLETYAYLQNTAQWGAVQQNWYGWNSNRSKDKNMQPNEAKKMQNGLSEIEHLSATSLYGHKNQSSVTCPLALQSDSTCLSWHTQRASRCWRK